MSSESQNPAGDIRVGPQYQARLPDVNESMPVQLRPERTEDWEEQRWIPSLIFDTDLLMFLRAARSMAAFAGMCDGGSPDDGCLAAARDDTTFNAMDVLHDSGYDLTIALQALVKCPVPKGMDKKWSEDETKRFVKGLRQYGKNFFRIRKELLPHKETGELIEYYYLWKKTPGANQSRIPRRHRRQTTLRRNRNTRSTRAAKEDTATGGGELSSASEEENSDDDSDSRDQNYVQCRHCFSAISREGHSSGTKEKGVLCDSCHEYSKKNGELPPVPDTKEAPYLFRPVETAEEGRICTRTRVKELGSAPETPTKDKKQGVEAIDSCDMEEDSAPPVKKIKDGRVDTPSEMSSSESGSMDEELNEKEVEPDSVDAMPEASNGSRASTPQAVQLPTDMQEHTDPSAVPAVHPPMVAEIPVAPEKEIPHISASPLVDVPAEDPALISANAVIPIAPASPVALNAVPLKEVKIEPPEQPTVAQSCLASEDAAVITSPSFPVAIKGEPALPEPPIVVPIPAIHIKKEPCVDELPASPNVAPAAPKQLSQQLPTEQGDQEMTSLDDKPSNNGAFSNPVPLLPPVSQPYGFNPGMLPYVNAQGPPPPSEVPIVQTEPQNLKMIKQEALVPTTTSALDPLQSLREVKVPGYNGSGFPTVGATTASSVPVSNTVSSVYVSHHSQDASVKKEPAEYQRPRSPKPTEPQTKTTTASSVAVPAGPTVSSPKPAARSQTPPVMSHPSPLQHTQQLPPSFPGHHHPAASPYAAHIPIPHPLMAAYSQAAHPYAPYPYPYPFPYQYPPPHMMKPQEAPEVPTSSPIPVSHTPPHSHHHHHSHQQHGHHKPKSSRASPPAATVTTQSSFTPLVKSSSTPSHASSSHPNDYSNHSGRENHGLNLPKPSPTSTKAPPTAPALWSDIRNEHSLPMGPVQPYPPGPPQPSINQPSQISQPSPHLGVPPVTQLAPQTQPLPPLSAPPALSSSVTHPNPEEPKTASVPQPVEIPVDDPEDVEEEVPSPAHIPRGPSPEPKIEDSECHRSQSAIFLRHWNRGDFNSCARTDLTFKPVPDSKLARKREERMRRQAEKEREERERAAAQARKEQAPEKRETPKPTPGGLLESIASPYERFTPRPGYADTPALRQLSEYARPHTGFSPGGIPRSTPGGIPIPPHAMDPMLHYQLSNFYGSRERLELEQIEREKRERELRELRERELNDRLKEEFMKSAAAGPRVANPLDPHWIDLHRRYVSLAQGGPPPGSMHQGSFGFYPPPGGPSQQAISQIERERLERLDPIVRLQMAGISPEYHTHAHTHAHAHTHLHLHPGQELAGGPPGFPLPGGPPAGYPRPGLFLPRDPGLALHPSPELLGRPYADQIAQQLSAQAAAQEQFQRQMMLERERFPPPGAPPLHAPLLATHDEFMRQQREREMKVRALEEAARGGHH